MNLGQHLKSSILQAAVIATFAVVGNTNGAGLACLVEIHHCLPLGLDHWAHCLETSSSCDNWQRWEMEDGTVHVVEITQLCQLPLQSIVGVLLTAHMINKFWENACLWKHTPLDLCLDENILTLTSSRRQNLFHTFTDSLIVEILCTSINHGEAVVKRLNHCFLGLCVVVLVDTTGHQRHLNTIAQNDGIISTIGAIQACKRNSTTKHHVLTFGSIS